MIASVTTNLLELIWSSGHSVNIDSPFSGLFYKLTSAIIGLAALLTGAREYIGDPITCLEEGYPEEILNNYCWAYGTYTIQELSYDSQLDELPHRGIGPHGRRFNTKVYHTVYQWIPVLLFLSSALFCLPHFLWIQAEGGKMSQLTKHSHNMDSYDKAYSRWLAKMLNEFTLNKGGIHCYIIKFHIFESANLAMLAVQVCLFNLVFQGKFLTLGYDFVRYEFHERNSEDSHVANPLETLFPRVGSCDFKTGGPSGNLQIHPTICTLQQNAVNQKIFLMLWFWFAALSCLSAMLLVIRFMFVILSHFRRYAVILKSSYSHRFQARRLSKSLSYSQYRLLLMVTRNIPADFTDDLIDVLSDYYVSKSRTISVWNGQLVKMGKVWRAIEESCCRNMEEETSSSSSSAATVDDS